MRTVRVAEIAEQLRGVTYGKEDASPVPANDMVPLLRANNITSDGIDFKDIIYVKENKVSDRQKLKRGDVVIAASSGSILVVGKAAQLEANFDGTFGAFCKVLRPGSQVSPRYFGHFFRTPAYRQRMSALAAGANINNLKNEHIDELEIPLPPLLEQERIAAILDQADSLRRLRQRAIDRLNSLGQAIFNEMFGKLSDENLHYLSDFAWVKGGKRLPKGAEYSAEPTKHPYIRVSDMENGAISLQSLKYIEPSLQQQVSRYIVNEGDVIISIAGSIGLTAPVPRNLDGANLTENAAKLVPKWKHAFDAVFLSHALSLPDAQAQVRSKTGQVTIGKLALFRIEQIRVPLPPIRAQLAFAQAMSSLSEQRRLVQRYAERMNQLFSGLQHRAFRGEL